MLMIFCLQLMILVFFHETKKFLSSNFEIKDMGENECLISIRKRTKNLRFRFCLVFLRDLLVIA